METKRDIVQVRVPKEAARRIDEVIKVHPEYAHRQHFVLIAVERLLAAVSTRKEAA